MENPPYTAEADAYFRNFSEWAGKVLHNVKESYTKASAAGTFGIRS